MIAQFSLRLICGMSLMWCIMPRSQVTSGFFRIQMLVVLGLSVLASLTIGKLTGVADSLLTDQLPPATGTVGCAMIAVLAYLGSIVWTLERRRAGSILAGLIALGSTSILLLNLDSADSFRSLTGSLALLSELSSAALLGGAVTGMLLGHWYLTAPTMSIAPLSSLTNYFGVASLIRLILSALVLVLAWDQLDNTNHWIWLGLRWLAGILGPLVIFVMVWKILKYRNTQAATGVLFVGVILTFIGEMTAALLYSELRIPL